MIISILLYSSANRSGYPCLSTCVWDTVHYALGLDVSITVGALTVAGDEGLCSCRAASLRGREAVVVPTYKMETLSIHHASISGGAKCNFTYVFENEAVRMTCQAISTQPIHAHSRVEHT